MKKLTTIEVAEMFRISKKELKQSREDGLPCLFLSGNYYYEYDELVRWFS